MAITADIRQQVFDLLSRASNLSFVGAEQESVGRSGLAPGQKVTAQVLSAFPDGRVQVGIGEERFNLELPMAVRPGQNLEMTFVSSEPRTTFAIARPASPAPMVSLSDASRLLALLAEGERISDPGLRASLKSVGEILQRSPGDAGVLASLLDQALTYGGMSEGSRPGSAIPSGFPMPPPSGTVTASPQGETGAAAGQLPLTGFESGASRILQQIARSSRSILVEAVNPPQMPLSLAPGDEVDALVLGTLPGGRVFVRVAGAELELLLPRPVQESEILRLTVVASQPRPLFAIPRALPDPVQGALSDAGRWLSVLEQSGGGLSDQQKYVLDRLATIMKSLPADSPAFTAILDEPITYRRQAAVTAHAFEQQQGSMVAPPPTPPQGSGVVISDDMAKLLQALIKGNRLTLLEALNQPPHGFEPGMQLKGEVLASLGEGRFLVQVAEQAFEFALPKGMRPGERLTLFYITDEPRSSFLMTRFGRPGDARVSEAGRWLSGFLAAAPERMAAGETLGVLRTILLGPPSDAPRVATLLQQGLRESGLFYESHLARWFEDDYRLEDLLREPQGRLSRLGQPDASPLAEKGFPDERPALEASGRLMTRAEASIGRNDGDTGHDGSVVDRTSLAVVREQLESLQSGQVVYRGELFAGQKMEWSVGDRETGRNAAGGRERGWDSVLRLDLPRLGAISARLKLDGVRISIELSTGNPDSAVSLDEGKQSLVEQLQAAGLEPAGIGIRHVGP